MPTVPVSVPARRRCKRQEYEKPDRVQGAYFFRISVSFPRRCSGQPRLMTRLALLSARLSRNTRQPSAREAAIAPIPNESSINPAREP